MSFYYLPHEYASDEHGALGICIGSLLSMIKESGAGPTNLFTAHAIFDRVFNGLGQGGEGICLWELVRWKNRQSTEAGALQGEHNKDDFLAWTGEDSPFTPRWRVYSNVDFTKMFLGACRNFVDEHPDRRREIESALEENGMLLRGIEDR